MTSVPTNITIGQINSAFTSYSSPTPSLPASSLPYVFSYPPPPYCLPSQPIPLNFPFCPPPPAPYFAPYYPPIYPTYPPPNLPPEELSFQLPESTSSFSSSSSSMPPPAPKEIAKKRKAHRKTYSFRKKTQEKSSEKNHPALRLIKHLYKGYSPKELAAETIEKIHLRFLSEDESDSTLSADDLLALLKANGLWPDAPPLSPEETTAADALLELVLPTASQSTEEKKVEITLDSPRPNRKAHKKSLEKEIQRLKKMPEAPNMILETLEQELTTYK